MRLTQIEAFQARWAPGGTPTQGSASMRVHTDEGISGLGEEPAPHPTQPTIGHMASSPVVASRPGDGEPAEWKDPSARMHAAIENPPFPVDGLLQLQGSPRHGTRAERVEAG
jgi:L-alanine-DL-glutamate epimerase-like enolase superfamily enzyme